MENRIIIYAPTGKDARLIAQALGSTGVECCICTRAAHVEDELKAGVGVLLFVDDALSEILTATLRFLSGQPVWSDLPILIMSQKRTDAPETRHAYQQLGNVTLLERPLSSLTLITAVSSALRARRRQYAMREVDRRKDEFLAMLAHELRNPLAPIGAASDLLKLPNLDRPRIRQTSEIISRQVKHMTGLIDDLLDVSRVSRGLVTLKTTVLDARSIVASAIEQVRPLMDARRHHLTLRSLPEVAFVNGDQKRLVQILANILNNASKYTAEGGELELRLSASAHEVVFTVVDNGIGIDPAMIGHIFDMFAQAERTSDRTQGGLGIGLALVKNLVQLHGGHVSAHSDGPGQGCTITVSFPRAQPPQDRQALIAEQFNLPTSGRRLLVVDDNIDAAMMLGMFLESGGYEVQVVNTAADALAVAVDASPFAACLLDIGLPDLDGNELAMRLHNMSSTSAAIFIAITGYGQESDRQKTSDAGFDHHLVKPVDMSRLMTTLSALA